MEKRNVIKEKSFEFAKEIVYLYKNLADKKEFVLSRQVLKSGTSIGANIREAEHAQSKADFINKLSISLKEAKYLVYYNIDFSSVSYWQSRDRLTTMQRKENEIFWLFSKGGIEYKIYKTVLQKKDYTLNLFKQHAGIKDTNQDKKEAGRKY